MLGLPYGDQGLLIPRALLDAVGGMRPLPLMEDVDLVAPPRAAAAWRRSTPPATTSAARWRTRTAISAGPLRNLACLALWFAGVPPRLIARLYA